MDLKKRDKGYYDKKTRARHTMLENRIPPVLLLLAWLVLIYLIAAYFPEFTLAPDGQIEIALILVLGGGLVIIAAVWQFKKAQTTVDPTRPDKASSLVDIGIFNLTRNPMYLGMTLIALAAVFYVMNLASLIFMLGLPLYLHCFQIKPEEQAMAKLFPAQWPEYKKRVRRWL